MLTHTTSIMEDQRKAIRPAIATEREPISSHEKFQNEVLRPILKMQNELLIAIFRHFMKKRKVKMNGMPKEKRDAWIAHSLSKDNRLRGMLLGTVIGQFTLQEWEGYRQDEGEIRRRITNLLTERLQSQANRLV